LKKITKTIKKKRAGPQKSLKNNSSGAKDL
jgi:hypothetical protein